MGRRWWRSRAAKLLRLKDGLGVELSQLPSARIIAVACKPDIMRIRPTRGSDAGC
jgi:hypothetical protein